MFVTLQSRRLVLRSAFFLLFIFAPSLNIFRLDLTLGHFILFGYHWTLGLDGLSSGQLTEFEAIFNILWRGFLPIAFVVFTGIWISWKYGRLYCGWLCPHFSVVELINGLMRRSSGKPTLWEKYALPSRLPNGNLLKQNKNYWWLVWLAVIGFAFLWSLTLLTYLLPPREIYSNLWHGCLTRNQAIFLTVATLVFSLEFLLARHLFCRFGCAIGYFQSVAWMANKQAMVVSFDKERAYACSTCRSACDHACPMRLKPRSIKRRMATCTQCAQCISTCQQVQLSQGASLLTWVQNEAALPVNGREEYAQIHYYYSDKIM